MLSEEQIIDSKIEFNIDNFIYLPQNLQNIWSNFDANLENIELNEFKLFLKNLSHEGDIVLIQGDFGATYTMIKYALELKLIPIYSTTNREISEMIENEQIIKKSIFKHVRFRKYE